MNNNYRFQTRTELFVSGLCDNTMFDIAFYDGHRGLSDTIDVTVCVRVAAIMFVVDLQRTVYRTILFKFLAKVRYKVHQILIINKC